MHNHLNGSHEGKSKVHNEDMIQHKMNYLMDKDIKVNFKGMQNSNK